MSPGLKQQDTESCVFEMMKTIFSLLVMHLESIKGHTFFY